MLFLPKLCYFCSQLNNTMNKNNLKHKYISVSIILLFLISKYCIVCFDNAQRYEYFASGEEASR